MIIVCAGDSFTHGIELWEEKNVPGYCDITDPVKASHLANSTVCDKRIDAERRSLSYCGSIQKLLGCEVINIGLGGASQVEIVKRAIETLHSLKDKKVVCLLQNTFIDRVWLWNTRSLKNFSVMLPDPESSYNLYKWHAMDIVSAYMKYIPEDLLRTEYYMQSLALQNFCHGRGIGFLSFNMWYHNFIEKSFTDSAMNCMMDTRNCVEEPIMWTLQKYFIGENFELPGLHFNGEAHQLIGEWLVEEMRKRNIV
jgi:hypothetical protein